MTYGVTYVIGRGWFVMSFKNESYVILAGPVKDQETAMIEMRICMKEEGK